MTRLLVATALATGLIAAPAFAADLPVYQEQVAYSPAPAFSWDGFYVGANVGYAWGTGRVAVPAQSVSGDYDGFLGGIQAGYNAQFGALVVGLETDLQLSGIDYSRTFATVAGNVTTKSDLKWFGTTRARLGYAADRFMPYITGGVAYADNKISATNAGATLSESKTHWGWALGAGVEAAVTNNVSLKAEYLYVDLERKTYFSAFGGGFRADADFHIGRVGLNYRF